MAGAGIEGASAGGMLVVKRQQVVEGGLSCLRAGGRSSNNSITVGGRRSCRYCREGAEGQQQQQRWWRRGRRGWRGYGVTNAGGGSSNSIKASSNNRKVGGRRSCRCYIEA